MQIINENDTQSYIFDGDWKQRLIISEYNDIFKTKKLRFQILNLENFRQNEIIDVDYNQLQNIINVLQEQLNNISTN